MADWRRQTRPSADTTRVTDRTRNGKAGNDHHVRLGIGQQILKFAACNMMKLRVHCLRRSKPVLSAIGHHLLFDESFLQYSLGHGRGILLCDFA
jgi:hypothetical protein